MSLIYLSPLSPKKCMNIGRTLEDDSSAARCLILNSYIIFTTTVRPQLKDVMWSTTVMLEGMASELCVQQNKSGIQSGEFTPNFYINMIVRDFILLFPKTILN